MNRTATVPDEATAIRLVRIAGDELREYEAMECNTGAPGIRRLLRQQMVRLGDYGMADLLDDNGDIIGEVELDRPSFRRVKAKLRARWVRPEPVLSSAGPSTAPARPEPRGEGPDEGGS